MEIERETNRMTTIAKTPISGPNSASATTPPAAKSDSGAKLAVAAKPSAAVQPASPDARWAKFMSPKYLLAIAAILIAVNSAAFFALRMRSHSAPPAKRNQEMVLGTFEFNRINPRDKQLKHGQFVVTLRLAENLDATKFRAVHNQEKVMQQAVEEAMRRMRASDFTDPRFIRLKNRFQERLNEELGFDGIEEVIVTNVPEQAAPDQTAPEQSADPQAAGGQGDATPSAQPDSSASSAASQSAPAN